MQNNSTTYVRSHTLLEKKQLSFPKVIGNSDKSRLLNSFTSIEIGYECIVPSIQTTNGFNEFSECDDAATNDEQYSSISFCGFYGLEIFTLYPSNPLSGRLKMEALKKFRRDQKVKIRYIFIYNIFGIL